MRRRTNPSLNEERSSDRRERKRFCNGRHLVVFLQLVQRVYHPSSYCTCLASLVSEDRYTVPVSVDLISYRVINTEGYCVAPVPQLVVHVDLDLKVK